MFEAIADELHESQAEIAIALGDLPLKWFDAWALCRVCNLMGRIAPGEMTRDPRRHVHVRFRETSLTLAPSFPQIAGTGR